MGYDYALVHAIYTIPPAILLSLIYFPLGTRLDLYRIAFLITIAVVATTPWDSYLIRTGIWSYPPHVVLGPKLFDIPIEELFFFVIQTFNTTLLYLLCNKPILHEIYLVREKKSDKWKYVKLVGQLALALGIKQGIGFVRTGGEQVYLGLILVWALPFLWLLWTLGYQFLVQLPLTSTLLPIVLPTLYLWIVDTLALQRGTWVIESGTKTGLTLWPALEIEEALFFLLTNTLIVAGLVAFDNAIAVLTLFDKHFPRVPALPSPILLVRALLLPASAYDDDRILGLQQAVARLQRKSRSFYLASSTFSGRLRLDLIILYSFCRVADDLVDHAASPAEAKQWVGKLKTYLDLSYSSPTTTSPPTSNGTPVSAKDPNQGSATLYTVQTFPAETQLTLLLLPTSRLAKEPLYELLKGFEMDLLFSSARPTGPIAEEKDLDLYGARVAGTVALLCIQLVLYHYPSHHHHHHKNRDAGGVAGGAGERKAKMLMAAGHDMGIALQYTNIARDLTVDAHQGRVYVPPPWLKKEKLTPASFISGLTSKKKKNNFLDGEDGDGDGDGGFFAKKVETLRSKLLDRSFAFYDGSVAAIESLPLEARAPMRVAVESYMQIARELRKTSAGRSARGGGGRAGGLWKHRDSRGRATVPKWKRIWVAWRRLLGPAPAPPPAPTVGHSGEGRLERK